MNVCGLSAIVDFIKLILLLYSGFGCVDATKKPFSRSFSFRGLYLQRQIKALKLSSDFSVGHSKGGNVWRGVGLPQPRRTHPAHILLRNKIPCFRKSFLFSVHYASEKHRIFKSPQVDWGGGVQHTRLCRLMVYSRDTTSAIAERLLPVLTLDISARDIRREIESGARETD